MNRLESIVITIFFLILSIMASAQVAVGQWQDHLSYNCGKQVLVVDNVVYMLSESGIVKYDKVSKESEKLTRLNVLSDVTPTRMAYEEKTGYLIIGYSSGNVDLIKDNEIININDIKQKSINCSKSINSIFTKDKYAYLGCDFGIVVLDLKRLEVKSTWFIGHNGSYVHVNDMDSDGENLYVAATTGVFKGNFNDALVDFSKWQVLTDLDSTSPLGWMKGKSYNSLKWFGDKLLVNFRNLQEYGDSIMMYNDNGWSHILPECVWIESLSGNSDTLLCSTSKALLMYNRNLERIKDIWWYYTYDGTYEVRTNDAFLNNGDIWIADNIRGLARIGSQDCEIIWTNSPTSNNVFDITSTKSRVLAVKGSYTSAYVPTWTTPTIYSYEDYMWTTRTPGQIPEISGNFDYVYISVDPNDANHYFISSWLDGLTEFRDDQFYKRYTDENSTLKKIDGVDWIRISGGSFDSKGNFWVANSLASQCLHVVTPKGEWTGFSIPDMTKNFRKMIVTRDGVKWVLLAQNGGILIFDDNGTPDYPNDDRYKHINILNENGETVSNDVYSIAEDKNGYVWVGTAKGVVVYYNPNKVFENTIVKGRQVKVPRNDGTENADLLLSTDVVTAICVDGANGKWFGTQNGGAYYTSADGTETIYHFCTDNSPIPSDNIQAITVVPETGEVFFATQKGIVSYRGTATEGNETYDEIYAFPNPVKSGYTGPVTIKGLVAGSIVKIADIAGNIVFEAKSTGGQLVWDGNNMNGRRVASGVYVVFVSTEIGEQKSTTKILFLK